MSNKRLASYLDKIANNTPINYQAFLKVLPEGIREDVQLIANLTFLKGNMYRVQIPCDELLSRLKELTIKPTNRSEASILGDSHKEKTSVSFMLAFHEKCHAIHPETIIITRTSVNIQFTPKKQLLIVENSELFFASDILFTQINKIFDLKLTLNDTDLIYGSGNQITHHLNQQFLAQYDSVICFLDYDLGGLTIFTGLKNMLGNTASFLEPPTKKLDKYFVKMPESSEHYFSALKKAQTLGLMKLHSCLLSQKAFMEQEVILAFK